MTPENRARIVTEARSWIKTPYHHAARIKGVGVDCGQLLYGVYIDGCGLVPPFDVEAYPNDWMMNRSEERFMRYITSHADEVDTPRPGDIALYMVGKCHAHAAIVVEWPTVIHADSKSRGVTLADGSQGWLAGREVKFFEVRA